MRSTLIEFYKGKRVPIRMDKTMNHSYQLKTTTKLLTSSLIFALQHLFVYVCQKADDMTLNVCHATVISQSCHCHAKEKSSSIRDTAS